MRVLILSAPVGQSHLAMAHSLAEDLRGRPEVSEVEVRNDFGVLGPGLGRVLGRGYDYHVGEVGWSYDLTYRLFTGVGAIRRLGERALCALGGHSLAATAAGYDLVLSTHPVLNAVLARLRATGRLSCPAVLVVGPLGGLAFWIQPGADLHLLNYEEAREQVEREAGPGSAVPVRPLVRAEFFSPPPRSQARRQLGIPEDRRVVLISGGGWGAGDLAGSVDATLAVPEAHAIAVTGRNERLRAEIEGRYGADPRVTVLGFTEQMPELLAAADAFVTATVGLSCLEAQLCGCATVCYGFTIGHVKDNVQALEQRGLAVAAGTPAELSDALRPLLERGARPSFPDRGALPPAGDTLVTLVAGPQAGQLVPRP